MSRFRLGAAVGGAAVAGLLVVRLGFGTWLVADGFIWLLAIVLAAIGGIVGGGVGLAWGHVRRAPALLKRVALVVLPLSLPIFWSYASQRRALPDTLARADSAYGKVLGRNVLGRVLVVARYPDGAGRLIAPRKLAHSRFERGDSIMVYFEREPPHEFLDVSPPGPDPWVMLTRAAVFWLFCGAMVAGYGPRHSRWLSQPLRERAE